MNPVKIPSKSRHDDAIHGVQSKINDIKNNHLDTDLPEGWVWCALREIVQLNPRHPSDTVPEDSQVSFLPMPALDETSWKIKERQTRLWREIRKGYTHFAEEDVLFAKITPCMENGKAAIAKDLANGIGCGTTELHVLRPETGISSEFVYHYIHQKSFRERAAASMTGTAGQLRVPVKFMEEVSIPLPPLPEQRLIVARVETLLERVRRAKEALEKVPQIMKRFRQAVLKKAFSGDLTAEWRAQQQDLEPAADLLKRIQEERRQRFEEEVRRAKAEGRKSPKKPKYLEMEPPDTSGMPELPEGWVWCRIGDIAESMKNGIYKPPQFYSDDGIACLRMYNIENGSIVWKDIKRMNLTLEEIQEYELNPGDILVNRVNSRELVGKAAPIPSGIERCVYESKNIRLRLSGNYIESKYASFWFQIFSQQYFNLNAQQTVGMASINQEQIGSMPIPFSHLLEQQEIVRRIETLFRFSDEVEKRVEEAMKRVEQITQSVLSKAFRGGLTEDFREAVKNWNRLDLEERRKCLVALPEEEREKVLCSDEFHIEPASVLLERIREGRAGREGAAFLRGRKRPRYPHQVR